LNTFDSSTQVYVAVVIDFDGPYGVIVVKKTGSTTGEKGKSEHGKYLHITSDTSDFFESEPNVYNIR
jgi:hypothetical protein